MPGRRSAIWGADESSARSVAPGCPDPGNLKRAARAYPTASSLDEVSGRISSAHERLSNIGHAARIMVRTYACCNLWAPLTGAGQNGRHALDEPRVSRASDSVTRVMRRGTLAVSGRLANPGGISDHVPAAAHRRRDRLVRCRPVHDTPCVQVHFRAPEHQARDRSWRRFPALYRSAVRRLARRGVALWSLFFLVRFRVLSFLGAGF